MNKLRIISGEFGGRLISANVGAATHPMGERPRAAVFNWLASRGLLENATVLDAFAGTGALGLEALSRGAKSATFIEQDRRAWQTIADNITTLDLSDRAKLVKTSVDRWLASENVQKFDLIFADPPYDNMQFSTVSHLTQALRQNGLMILSYPGRESLPDLHGVVVVDKRVYGEAGIALFRLST